MDQTCLVERGDDDGELHQADMMPQMSGTGEWGAEFQVSCSTFHVIQKLKRLRLETYNLKLLAETLHAGGLVYNLSAVSEACRSDSWNAGGCSEEFFFRNS